MKATPFQQRSAAGPIRPQGPHGVAHACSCSRRTPAAQRGGRALRREGPPASAERQQQEHLAAPPPPPGGALLPLALASLLGSGGLPAAAWAGDESEQVITEATEAVLAAAQAEQTPYDLLVSVIFGVVIVLLSTVTLGVSAVGRVGRVEGGARGGSRAPVRERPVRRPWQSGQQQRCPCRLASTCTLAGRRQRDTAPLGVGGPVRRAGSARRFDRPGASASSSRALAVWPAPVCTRWAAAAREQKRSSQEGGSGTPARALV